MWREIKKIINTHNRFLITTHINPDGDGIGAACALKELLSQMGKQALIVTETPIPAKFQFLDYHQAYEVFDSERDYSLFQVLIVLDTHRKERIGRIKKLLEDPAVVVICVDHHEPTEILTAFTVIDTKACCVGAMIYTLYKECGFSLNTQAAAGIYTSVICDTGRFSYSSTNRKAHKIADECIKLGVDPDLMHSRLFQHVPLVEIKMFANVLKRMEMHLNNKVVVQQIFQEDYHNVDGIDIDIEHADLEYFNDFNKMIEDVECIVLLRELPGHQVRASLRSKSDLNINAVVEALGGGGHSKAAGLTCEGSLEDVKLKILSSLENLFAPK